MTGRVVVAIVFARGGSVRGEGGGGGGGGGGGREGGDGEGKLLT